MGITGQAQRVGGEIWLLDTEASDHFTYDSTKLVGYAQCNRILRCTGGATYLIVDMGSL